jgi:hypothetical protein
VFAGARVLSADSRPAYFAEACAGNEALPREVESLLASDQRAKSFLEAPAMVRGDDARARMGTGEGLALSAAVIAPVTADVGSRHRDAVDVALR